MKKAITAVVFAATTAVTAFAQQPAAGRPAGAAAARPTAPAVSSPAPQGGNAALGVTNIAIIDIQAFGDQKNGIARLLGAYATLEREFKPRQDEMRNLKARYDALGKEYEQVKSVAKPEDLNTKIEQMQTLEKEIKRKQEDAQAAVEKREQELTGPVWDDVNNALRSYAAQRGIHLIFEKSKLAGNGLIFIVNDSMDITRAFIADYNQRNPASAAAAPANRP